MSADLAVVAAMRAAFVASGAVMALCPAANILDIHDAALPEPAIVLGDVQELLRRSSGNRNSADLVATLHLWKSERSFEGCKRLKAALADALRMSPRPTLEAGYHLADWRVVSARYLRDPDGQKSHGVVTVEALVSWVAI